MKGLKLQYPTFEDYTVPHGFLPNEKGAHACWYFYVLAEKMRIKAGTGIDSQIITVPAGQDGDYLWMNKNYEQLARSIATLYGLESPDEFQKFWREVLLQAVALGMDAPHAEYTGRIRLTNVQV